MKLFLVTAVLGRLALFLIQKFPLPRFLNEITFIHDLFECDLCLGVWLFTPLAWGLGFDVLKEFGLIYIPFISELLSGMFLSFTVYIFRLGWQDRFSNITYTLSED